MDIITRNFFRLLRAGIFDEQEEIEPMSAWKWRRLYHYSLMHGISALLYDGMVKCNDQFYLQLPDDLKESWLKTTQEIEGKNRQENAILRELYQSFSQQQLRPVLLKGQRLASLYPVPVHRLSNNIEIFFPFQTQGEKADQWARQYGTHLNESEKKYLTYEWKQTTIIHNHRLIHLTNRFLDSRLHSMIEQEFRESKANIVVLGNQQIECLNPTLEMLYILVSIAKRILSNGIPMKLFVDLGIMLRTIGNHVDFVKLQEWIDDLHMQSITHLSAVMLVTLFRFSNDEVPFLIPEKGSDLSRVLDEIFDVGNQNQSEWYFQQGKDIFVHTNNSSAMLWHVQHSTRYFKYFPAESVTNFFSSFANSLSHIEE